MKKIIITNASDCIGINLANLLLEDENNIIYAYDKYLSDNIPSLFSLLRNERYNFTEQDLTEQITQICDEVYHISPCLKKEKYLENKYSYIINEFNILTNILNYASLTGSKLLNINLFNDYKPSNKEYFPYFKYIETSHCLIEEYSKKYKIDYKIAQISDYYGINSNRSADNFVGECIFRAFNNENISVEQNENIYLTNVKDIVKGLVKIMNNYCDDNIFDISNPNPCLKSDIVRLIISFTKSHSPVNIDGGIPIESQYIPDIKKINNLLDFRCTTPILEGISTTIDFYKLMYFS